MCVEEEEGMNGKPPLIYSFVLRQGLSVNLQFNDLDKLAGQWIPGLSVSSPALKFQAHSSSISFVSRIGNDDSYFIIFHWQAHYWLSHFYSPSSLCNFTYIIWNVQNLTTRFFLASSSCILTVRKFSLWLFTNDIFFFFLLLSIPTHQVKQTWGTLPSTFLHYHFTEFQTGWVLHTSLLSRLAEF